jgi:hypothetical protein
VLDNRHAFAAPDRESELVPIDASFRETNRELGRLRVWHLAQQKALKSRFNVFTAVLSHDDEVRLHSRWLHYLLNPAAEHDCNTLFLDLFIKTLQMGVQPHENEAELNRLDELNAFVSNTVEAKKELQTKHGNLDIHIECPNWGVIVVENKTRSGEGEYQISDYAEYCGDYCHGRQYILLFLTPDGRQAQTAGKHEKHYYRISYRYHILRWLEECLRATYQFVHINQALQQYKIVVDQLLNRSSDTAYMKDVTEILRKYPSIIEHIDQIKQAVEIIRQNYWQAFVPELRTQLRQSGITLGEGIAVKECIDFELQESNALQRTGFSELRTTLEYWETENCLLIGESVWPFDKQTREKFWTEKRDKLEPMINRLASAYPGAYQRRPNQGWPIGWAEFLKGFMLPEFLANNATQGSCPMPEQAAKVAEKIRDYFKVLRRAWAEAGL